MKVKLLLFTLCISISLHGQQLPIQHAIKIKTNIIVDDYWVSEKLDGVRAYWTGRKLLTRNGNEIAVPDWFTKGWPNHVFEGEIWSARNEFQRILACIKRKKKPFSCWKKLKLMLFDLPTNDTNFTQRIKRISDIVNEANSPYLLMIKQEKITDIKALYQRLHTIVQANGEGLMLHHKDAFYQQGRNKQLMKLKKYQDAEAKVIKHYKGKGKYINALGALLVETPSGLQFKIGSGFSDQQRKDPPPLGSIITYKYIGKTQRGVPRFASFLRLKK